MQRPIYLPDNYTLLLVGMVVLASVLPASGDFAHALGFITKLVIGLLFFLHGAKLPREAIIAGLTHWRLHLMIFACTFVFFPVMGLVLRPVLEPLVTQELYIGVLFLCMLPATVQSSIALTSLARGNVPAAICSASASTILGVFITPFLVNWLVVPTGNSSSSLDAVGQILVQLMLPFVVGHALRPLLREPMKRAGKLIMLVDRSSILLIVYAAFSAAVVNGLWKLVSWADLGGLILIAAILLGIALLAVRQAARLMGLNAADTISATFCGSQKSLASGVPIAQVLFAAPAVGMMVLPLMIYHQMQLIISSLLAQRWARKS